MGEVLTADRIRENLQLLGDLPSLSPVVAQLIATLGSEDVSVGEVEAIIRRDPVIAAKVVSSANAAAYASHTPTTSIRGALMRLGLLRIRRLAVLISLYNAVPGRAAFQEAFWRHSLAVAHAVEVVARELAASKPGIGVNPDMVFLSGLMHDIGLLVLASHYPKQYTAVGALAGERGLPLWEAEVELLKVDHGEIGACLIEHWALADEIAQAARYHHRLTLAPPEHRWITAVLHVGDVACCDEPSWDLGEGVTLGPEDATLEVLGLSLDALAPIIDTARSEAREATAALERVGSS